MRILAISGSTRARSTNTRLLRALARHAPPDHLVEIEAELGRLPIFSPDLEEDTPAAVLELAARVEACDGIIIAAPEYAHGIAGGLKNALDWLVSRDEIPGKPVMLVHASTRSTSSRAHLREVLQTMSCRLYPGPEFEVHLVGKAPDEVEALLDTEVCRRDLRRALDAFARFAAGDGQAAASPI